MKRHALIALALFVPVPLAAQEDKPASAESRPAAKLAGSWALKVDGANVFRFDIARDGGTWKGAWIRPKSFASTGDSFSRFSEETITIGSGEGKAMGEWAELTFPDDRPRAVPDIFRFHLIGADRVEMIYADTGLAPFTLVRVPATTQLGPFEAGKIYRRVTVATLGLPPEDDEGVPKPTAKPAGKPVAPVPADSWKMPPRQTSGAPAEGGR
jgi:hypothetical protein